MEGIATFVDHNTVAIAEAHNDTNDYSLASGVQHSLQSYFANLGDQQPANLYNMVLAEVEMPLLKMVMRYTNNNQSRAAKILGISRGTLRKKLAIYKIGQSIQSDA